MAYSGYQDTDSVEILNKYQLINEQIPVIGGTLDYVEGLLDNPILNYIGVALIIVDPTGILSWPEAIRAYKNWVNTRQGMVTSPQGLINGAFFILSLLCIIPVPGVRNYVAGLYRGIIKPAGKNFHKMEPEKVIKILEDTFNKILKDDNLKNAAITGIDGLLKLAKQGGETGIYNILAKLKTSLQSGKINLKDLLGATDQQFLAVRETARQSELLVKGNKGFVIPKPGSPESKQFWETVAQQGRTGRFGPEFTDYFNKTDPITASNNFWANMGRTQIDKITKVADKPIIRRGGRLALSQAPAQGGYGGLLDNPWGLPTDAIRKMSELTGSLPREKEEINQELENLRKKLQNYKYRQKNEQPY
jgi:hypothetical protein